MFNWMRELWLSASLEDRWLFDLQRGKLVTAKESVVNACHHLLIHEHLC